MSFRIIDNFLPLENLENLERMVNDDNFSWKLSTNLNLKDKDNNPIDYYYMVHTLYWYDIPMSPYFDSFATLFNSVLRDEYDFIRSLMRAKINMYLPEVSIREHEPHVDTPHDHKVCLFYLNTCDGYTTFEKNGKVMSKRNRAVLFDGTERHWSSTSTSLRYTINLNYL